MATTKNSNNSSGVGSVRDDEIIAAAWPEGMNLADRALWEQAAPDMRSLIIRRLDAILAAETGASPIGDIAHQAGMDRTRFFRLRQRWRTDRTLRNVIPQAHRRPRKIAPRTLATGQGALAAKEMVERAVAETRPSSSTSTIAREVVESLNGAISLQTATRLIRQERARKARDAGVLRDRFGEATLIDLSAVTLAISDGVDAGGAVVVAVVLDMASRLIVGHAAGGVHESLRLQHRAIQRALNFLDIDRPQGFPSKAKVVLGWSDDKQLKSLDRFVISTPGVSTVQSNGPIRFGRALIDLIGHRIDRLRLRPRATDPDTRAHYDITKLSQPPMSAAHARALVDEAVENYNAPIIALLTEAGLLRPTGPAGMRIAMTLSYLVLGFS